MPEKLLGRLEMEGKGGAERRVATRVDKAIDLTFEIKSLPDEKTLIETLDRLLVGQSMDVSATGIGLWTSKIMMPGTSLELHIPPSGASAPIDIKARVVWCQPHTEGGFVRARVGVEFVDLPDPVRAQLEKMVGA
jgi:c-di-GMP-binding flagellar brake protein YcgR